MAGELGRGHLLGADAGKPDELALAMARQLDLNAAIWKTIERIAAAQERMAGAVELEHLPHVPGVTEVVVKGEDDSTTTWGIFCIACTQARGDYTRCLKPGENAMEKPNTWPLSDLLVERPMPEPTKET